MGRFLRKIYKYWGSLMAIGLTLYYNKWCKSILKQQNIPNKKVEGEDEYLKKWKQLSHYVNTKYYRIFSQYIKPDPNIVPEDICHNVIEHVLNPVKHRVFYSDKNMYDKLFTKGTLPTTILRCIENSFYDDSYNTVDSDKISEIINNIPYNAVILKPTIDSCSGHGVLLYIKGDDGFLYNKSDNKRLTNEILCSYGNNWILQECVEQHSFMSKFNKTSVNTLRVLVYRSPIDNKPKVLNSIMRIGQKGSHLDNAHAGGLFVGISKNGTVGKFLCDQYGNKYKEFNDINFSDSEFKIPEFDKIIKFSEYISRTIIHLRLLSLDIMIDKNGTPRLIEFNVYALGTWAFQFATHCVFGECTDEIIKYCKEQKSKIERVRVSVW